VPRSRHLALLSLAWPCLAAAQADLPAGAPSEALHALAAAGWRPDDTIRRGSPTSAPTPCLALPDPALRDTLALTAWLHTSW
jgi:hypothetical protein